MVIKLNVWNRRSIRIELAATALKIWISYLGYLNFLYTIGYYFVTSLIDMQLIRIRIFFSLQKIRKQLLPIQKSEWLLYRKKNFLFFVLFIEPFYISRFIVQKNSYKRRNIKTLSIKWPGQFVAGIKLLSFWERILIKNTPFIELCSHLMLRL
jgi:hypothetical protein